MPGRRLLSASLILLLVAISAVLYLRSGLAAAYLVADDFQWIAGGRAFSWPRLLEVSSRGHFYRPVIDLWFGLTAAACGGSSTCYHVANLIVHSVNVALVFLLTRGLFRDLRGPFLATLIFSIEPAHAHAVVWVSAVTSLLATSFYLVSLLALMRSWTSRTDRGRMALEFVAVSSFAAALFAHEAAATLPLVAIALWWHFSPGGIRRRPVVIGGFALALVVFAAATVLANQQNYVFVERNYAFGLHAVRHALDYLVALYVGPSWWGAYLLCLAGMFGLLLATPVTRVAALWLLVTLLPYVWFTWGNSSRYLYLPSIGFGIAVAAVVVASCDAIARRVAFGSRIGAGGFVVLVAFVLVRFGQFCTASIESHVAATEHWRTYAKTIAASASRSADNIVRVQYVPDDIVDAMYLEPMLQWEYQDYGLTVITLK